MQFHNMESVRLLFFLPVVLGLVRSASGAGIALDGVCTVDGNCTVTANAGKCSDAHKCKCNDGYTANWDKSACIVADGFLEGNCTTNASCSHTLHAETCTALKCKCNTGFTANTIVCKGTRGTLDGACNADSDCSGTPHAGKCTDTDGDKTPDICKCSTGYKANTGSTSCIAADGYLEGTCTNNATCNRTANASACITQICKCNSGFTANSDNTTCLVNGALGGKCTASTECTKTANAGTCTSAKCVCDAGFSLNPDKTACFGGNTGSVAMASTWILVIASVPVAIYL